MHIEIFPQDTPEGRARLKLVFSAPEVAAELEASDAGPAPESAAAGGGGSGDDAALVKAADSLVNRGIDAAVRDHGFRPVGEVSVRMDECGRGQGLTALVEAQTLPAVAVPASFEGLSVRIEEAIPTKAEIHAMLERLRRSRGRLERVEEQRLPRPGDVLALSVDGLRDGVPAPDLHVENYLLNDANAARTPEIARLARTLHVGESGSCILEDAALFPAADARGQRLEVRVTLRGLMREVLPECDEAFAAQCGFASLAALRSALYRERMAFLIARNRKRAEAALLEDLLRERDFAVPPVLLRAHERECLREAEAALRRSIRAPAEVRAALERRRPALEAEALGQARAQTWLMACGYAHGLRVTEQELSARIREMAAALGRTAEELQREFEASTAMAELQDRLLAEKALAMIYARARKIIVDAAGNEVRHSRDSEEAGSKDAGHRA